MITIPSLKPELLKDLETDFGTSIAQAIWKKMRDQVHWINAGVPIGIILWFYGSQTYANGDPVLISNSWQFCDGSLISDIDSILIGQNVPDLRNKYMPGDPNDGDAGGQSGHSVFHDHTGETNLESDYADTVQTEIGEDFKGYFNFGDPNPLFHKHTMSGANAVITLDPSYIKLQPYMRIK